MKGANNMIGDMAYNSPRNKYPQYARSAFNPVTYHTTLASPSWVCSYTKNYKQNASDPHGGSLVDQLIKLANNQAKLF